MASPPTASWFSILDEGAVILSRHYQNPQAQAQATSTSTTTSTATATTADEPEYGDGEVGDLIHCTIMGYCLSPSTSSLASMIPTTEPCLTMTDIAITIGDSEVPPSLELAMRFVRSADAQPLTLRSDPKYAFGSSTTRPQIPPNASFQFTIHPSHAPPFPDKKRPAHSL